MKYGLAIILLIVSVITMAVCAMPLLNEKSRLRTLQPVRMKMVSHLADRPTGSPRQSGDLPLDIEYRYEFNGRSYASLHHSEPAPGTVTPTSLRTRLLSADQDIEEIDAYVNPASPGEPQFAQPADASQYLPILFPLPLMVLLLVRLAVPDATEARRVRSPAPMGGRYELRAIYSMGIRRSAVTTATLIWNGVTWPVALDYFLYGDTSAFGNIAIVSFMLIGIVMLVAMLYYLRIDSRIQSSRFRVDMHPIMLGKSVDARLEQEFSRRVDLAEVRIGLVCLHTKVQRLKTLGTIVRSDTRIIAQQWREFLFKNTVESHQHITLDATLIAPAEGKRSSAVDANHSEWYAWQLRVHLSFRDGPDIKTHYPVLVENYQIGIITKSVT